jgi:hypothetical protein
MLSLLRLVGPERLTSPCSESPSPSDDLRKRNMPLSRRVRLPSAKTSGTAVNLVSEGEKTQKQRAAVARLK